MNETKLIPSRTSSHNCTHCLMFFLLEIYSHSVCWTRRVWRWKAWVTLPGPRRTISSRTGRRKSATHLRESLWSSCPLVTLCATRTCSPSPTARCTGRKAATTCVSRSTGTSRRKKKRMDRSNMAWVPDFQIPLDIAFNVFIFVNTKIFFCRS